MEVSVRKVLKLRSPRIISSVVKTLHLVLSNIKTTWLIDWFSCTSSQLLRLITELQLQTELCVIQVCDDIFVANREGLTNSVTTRSISEVLVIDVSPKLDIPILIAPNHPSYVTVLKHIEFINTEIGRYLSKASLSEVFHLPPGEFPLELTFVFGWLLGYPFIYFNSEHLATQINCLSDIPLKLFQVSYGGFNFLSFSIPLTSFEEQKGKGELYLMKLKEQLNVIAVKSGYQNIEIHSSIQTLTIVAL